MQGRQTEFIACRIPPEILGAIFAEMKDDNRYGMITRWFKSVSHVCSYWREVALANPSLWADIQINSSPLVMEMVRRSKAAPLIIKYCELDESDPADSYTVLNEILCHHLSRVKSLDLRLHSTRTNRPIVCKLLALIGQPAPMLECLYIESFDPTVEIVVCSSRLQHLTLSRCRLTRNLENTDFRNLRSLVIDFYKEETAHLLGILRQTPFLERLRVETNMKATLPGGTFSPQTIHPINLEYLESFVLVYGLPGSVSLLDSIAFSNLKNAQISTNLFADESSIPFAEALGRKIDDSIEGSISRLRLTSNVLCWKTKDTELPAQGLSPSINGCFAGTSDYLADGARDRFLQSLRLDHLRSLDICAKLKDNIWTLLSDLPRLKDLRILGNGFSLIAALNSGLVDSPDASPLPLKGPSFVSLRNLTIVEWKLYEFNFGTTLFDFMTSSLGLRKKAGLSLELLQLQDCRGFCREDFRGLKKIAKQVEWIADLKI
ncbi:hypothetical protein H2248_004352 [Termitomyces sp. 'cryptogamus']|nr:hypothetical protein H2248_004352 [Termitomyces sp. 'cryptogamus']